MIITLYIDFIDDDGDAKRQITIKRSLPNSDGFHLFEAWMSLSKCVDMPSKYIDSVMGMLYDIVMEEVELTLGFTENHYAQGKYDIEDPMSEDENNMSAIISVHV